MQYNLLHHFEETRAALQLVIKITILQSPPSTHLDIPTGLAALHEEPLGDNVQMSCRYGCLTLPYPRHLQIAVRKWSKRSHGDMSHRLTLARVRAGGVNR